MSPDALKILLSNTAEYRRIIPFRRQCDARDQDRLCLAALMTLPGLAGCASHGPDTAPAAAWGQPRFAAWQETDPAYRFYPGDTIEVTVHSAPELSRTVEIGPDGAGSPCP